MADEAGYLLSEFDASWVVNNAGQKMSEQREFVRRSGAPLRLCKNGASAIAARSGSTISSQSCTLYKGSGGTLASLTDTITVYNLGPVAIAANAYIIAALAGDIWIATWNDRQYIIDIRLSGSDLQYTFDGVTWTTWHTGTSCP